MRTPVRSCICGNISTSGMQPLSVDLSRSSLIYHDVYIWTICSPGISICSHEENTGKWS